MTGIATNREARGLTDRQKRLVDDLTNGITDHEAAGYGSAAILGAATSGELVQAELKLLRAARIRSVLAQKALAAMEDLITNEKTPAATRFGAAKWVLEQAGHRDDQDDASDKPLHEMSEAELHAFMAKAQKTVEQGGSPPLIVVTPRTGAE